jgi:translocator assembly and maintenance protein 41
VLASHGVLRSNIASSRQLRLSRPRHFSSTTSLLNDQKPAPSLGVEPETTTSAPSPKTPSAQVSEKQAADAAATHNDSLPPGWEDDPDWNITAFSQLPHRTFGFNQHMKINEEFKEALRQVLWRFRAPIRYAFAYGSGVFSQSSSTTPANLTPHPHPPEAIVKWQKGGGKMIDFIFGVSYTQHWHSINLQQHRDHYSFLGSLGSGLVSRVQDNWGAGVYFNPYITVNGTLIKYGVVNLDTIQRDLSQWDSLYLAGRLQKPVKILRDDPKVRLANQINLISAVRTALLMLGPTFTERELYTAIAGISYLGDPRMSLNTENPNKVSNIVRNQTSNFRQLYSPLIEDLPNVTFNDPRCRDKDWLSDPDSDCHMQQDMDPQKRGNMVRRLPKSFREKVYFLYQGKFAIPGAEFDKMLEASKDEDDLSFKRREGGEFDKRIAKEDDLKDVVRQAIQKTVKWPSTSQSIKSAITAGPSRSLRYWREKREKGKEIKEVDKGLEEGQKKDSEKKKAEDSEKKEA